MATIAVPSGSRSPSIRLIPENVLDRWSRRKIMQMVGVVEYGLMVEVLAPVRHSGVQLPRCQGGCCVNQHNFVAFVEVGRALLASMSLRTASAFDRRAPGATRVYSKLS